MKEIKAKLCKIVTTLPWLGEQEDTSIISAKNHNKIIKRVALKYDLLTLIYFQNSKNK